MERQEKSRIECYNSSHLTNNLLAYVEIAKCKQFYYRLLA